MDAGSIAAIAPVLSFVIAAAVFCGGYYLHRAMYAGASANLADARVGEVYHFIYNQPAAGSPERFLAKVVSVREMQPDELARLDAKSRYRRYDGNFERSKHLVKCQTLDGRIRSFYAERTSWARKPRVAQYVYRYLPTFAAYML